MNFFLIAAVAALAPTATAQNCGRRNEPADINYIIGGSEASPHEFPWQILQIYFKETASPEVFSMSFCGGSIINDQWFVTAAHCHESPKLKNYLIYAGAHHLSEEESEKQVFRIEKAIKHPDWSDSTTQNDIALVKISGRFNLDNRTVAPICLPTSSDNIGFDTSKHVCVTSGWGSTAIDGTVSDVLRHVDVPIVPNLLCSILYDNSIRRSQICAGNRSVGAFQGDSGGPLACLHNGRYTLTGVTSFVELQGSTRYPVVYTRVSQYRDWIDNIVATQ